MSLKIYYSEYTELHRLRCQIHGAKADWVQSAVAMNVMDVNSIPLAELSVMLPMAIS
jgi:hypothetical protein